MHAGGTFTQLLSKVLGAQGGFLSPWLVVGFVILCFVVYVIRKLIYPAVRSYRLGQRLCQLCGTDAGHWFYGHTQKYSFDETGLQNIANRTKSFPSIFCSWVGPFLPQVAVYHPDTVIPTLAHIAPKNELAYRIMRPWIGDGLLTSSGRKWQRNRRLITPAFHYNILKQYLKVFNGCARTLLDNWKHHNGNHVDVSEGISLMTLDTMLQCAMSFETNCQNVKGKHPYILAVKDLTNLIVKRMENPIYLIDRIFYATADGRKFKQSLDVVHKQAEKVIAQRKGAIAQDESANFEKKNEKQVLDFLDILLKAKDEEGKGLTDQEIRDEVDTFLFEGHDTTASAISWIFHNLAKHPEFQDKCRREVDAVIGNKREVEWEDLSNLTYITMFIKESMRLYPPVPAVGRYLKSPLTLPKQVTIPPNCNVAVSIFACHRNFHVWENPEIFDPERFTLENISKRSSHAFVPFSAGPRNCIGQNFAMNEIKTVVCQLLATYRLSLDRDTDPPVMKPQLVLWSENGIVVKLEDLKRS